jgi:hypothetical protein
LKVTRGDFFICAICRSLAVNAIPDNHRKWA